MPATFTQPQNRLRRFAGKKGLSRAEAVEQAAANIEQVRQPTIAYVDEHLERLTQLMAQVERAQSDPTPPPPPLAALYDSSNAITSTSDLFGLSDLGKAAFSLCECLVYMEQNETWHPDAVKAHLNGMRIMRRQNSNEMDYDGTIIIDNLEQLLPFLMKKTG